MTRSESPTTERLGPPPEPSREVKRRKLLISAFMSWLKDDNRKGTRPRKIRLGQSTARSIQTRKRTARDRRHRQMTKCMVRVRAVRGQDVHTGR